MTAPAKMNIAYVIDKLYSLNGGTERQLSQLIRGMTQRGHKVRLYVYRHTEFTKSLGEFDCPVESLGITSIASITAMKRLWAFRRRLAADGTDIVHGFFNDVALTLPAALIRGDWKVFTSRRDMGLWYSTGKLILLRALSKAPGFIICNSEAVARLTHEREHKPTSRLIVIKNGVDSIDEGSQIAAAAELAPTVHNATKVLLVANIRPIKRLDDLVAAAALINDCNIEFWIAGHLSDQPYFSAIKNAISELALEHRFHFLGPVPEPRALMGQFDIGVLCSESEGLSNTLIEYLGAGLAIIASNVGGNPEVIHHEINGLLYPKADVNALAEKLRRLCHDSAFRNRLGFEAKQSFRSFSVDTMLSMHEQAYASPLEVTLDAIRDGVVLGSDVLKC
jgi:L-malate glycosyltransferase